MADPNHAWNDGAPIRSKKQACGCHITAKKFELCAMGKKFKLYVESCYKFYLYQSGVPCNSYMIESSRNILEMNKTIYLTHLAKGWDWPQMMWGPDRCL